MTPEDLRRVAVVVDRATAHPDFAGRFYERLFAQVPDARALFGDLDAQEAKLAEELAALVSLLGDLDTLTDRAGALGARHRGYGVRAGHYRVFQEVMREVLAELLGDDFGPDDQDSWLRATTLVTELMQS
ncbi:MAG: hypothetical protein KDA98_13060 [Acidimicrobiales bacterium]|nr:hypothetical protein [Acidimicrobiales bacterium]